MQKVLKFIFSVLGLLVLIACPASHFYNYEYVGNNLTEKNKETKINEEKLANFKNAKCGFLNRFIDGKEKLLIVKIDSLNNEIKSVKSKNVGILEKVEKAELNNLNILDSQIYRKKFNSKNQNKILKIIKNDTITIELKNGLKYYFAKK